MLGPDCWQQEGWFGKGVAPRGRSVSAQRAVSAVENGTEGQGEADRGIRSPRVVLQGSISSGKRKERFRAFSRHSGQEVNTI